MGRNVVRYSNANNYHSQLCAEVIDAHYLMHTDMPTKAFPTIDEVDSMTNESILTSLDADLGLLRNLIPLWHAEMAWAKELLMRAFKLQNAQDILGPRHRGRHQIPGTTWFVRTHGIGVDIYRTPDVGGIDFDFDKPDPDSWRLKIFLERQLNAGALSYEIYRHLVDDEERLQLALDRFFPSA